LDEQGKIYWHGAHHEALQLELHEYIDALKFENEHELNKEALRMDTLIIKKIKDVQIKKNIGKIFRNHNIVEYKSETDSFSFWDYQKVLGYAFIYSSFEKIPMSDITISISLTIYPRELIKLLKNERRLEVEDLDNGIYYISGDIVPIQILESKQLSPDSNLFLRNLRSNLSAEDMLKTLQSYKERKPLDDKNVFLDRLVKANPKAFKEAMNMTEGVMKIFLEGAEEYPKAFKEAMNVTEGVMKISLEGAEEYGWLNDRDIEIAKRFAKKSLIRGRPIEEVAEDTGLPLETVRSLQYS